MRRSEGYTCPWLAKNTKNTRQGESALNWLLNNGTLFDVSGLWICVIVWQETLALTWTFRFCGCLIFLLSQLFYFHCMSSSCSYPHEFFGQITLMNDVLLSKRSKQWIRIALRKTLYLSDFLVYISRPFLVTCFLLLLLLLLALLNLYQFPSVMGFFRTNPWICVVRWDLADFWHDFGLVDQVSLIQYFNLFRLDLQGIGGAEIGSGME